MRATLKKMPENFWTNRYRDFAFCLLHLFIDLLKGNCRVSKTLSFSLHQVCGTPEYSAWSHSEAGLWKASGLVGHGSHLLWVSCGMCSLLWGYTWGTVWTSHQWLVSYLEKNAQNIIFLKISSWETWCITLYKHECPNFWLVWYAKSIIIISLTFLISVICFTGL